MDYRKSYSLLLCGVGGQISRCPDCGESLSF